MTPLENTLVSGELVAWRLDQNEYHETWDSSEGSYKFGGRWSASGVWAIYCSIDRILGKYTEYDPDAYELLHQIRMFPVLGRSSRYHRI